MKMLKMSVSKKLLGGFLSILLILAGITGISYHELKTVNNTSGWLF